jgi:hypothetical protein
MNQHPEETADWKITASPRGTLSIEAQNEAQKPTANNRKDRLESSEVESDYEDVQLVAIGDEEIKYAWRDSNPQPTAP